MASNDEVITQIKTLETSLCTRLDKVEKSVSIIDIAIRGNDKPGIKTRLKLLETKFKGVDWFSKIIAGAVLIDIIARVSESLK
jgi:hypothetical protein